MDFIFEIVMELLFEGSIEISKNKKISKWIRYPILFFLILFFLMIIFILIITGLVMMKQNLLISLFFIMIGLFLYSGKFFLNIELIKN